MIICGKYEQDLLRHFDFMVGLVRWDLVQDAMRGSKWFYGNATATLCLICSGGVSWHNAEREERCAWLCNHRDCHIAQLDPVLVEQAEVLISMRVPAWIGSALEVRPASRKFICQEVIQFFWPGKHPVPYGNRMAVGKL